uniref:Pathogenesis-related protein 1A n=1 Tax=Cacopsylla melanoneura TaxID=428564 RepID=A0A8D8RP62_9HEMI
MKTQVLTFILSCLYVTRITVGQVNARHAHPFYVQTFPIHSSPQLATPQPAWSGGGGGGVGSQSSQFQSLSSSKISNIQYGAGGQPYYVHQQPAPVAYQTITITDYSNNGTRENRLTSKLTDPIDIAKLFQALEKSDNRNSPWKTNFQWSSFQKQPSYDSGNSQQFDSYDTQYALGGTHVHPDQNGVQWFHQKFPANSLPPVVPLEDKFKYVYQPSPAGKPVKTQNSFEFPSSEELNNVWGNKLDDSNEEKNEDIRSTTFRQTKKFVQAGLDAHNVYRKKHRAPALGYNQQVAKVAQAWASKLIGSISKGGHLQHRPNNKYGENLWMGSGYKFSDEEAIKFAIKSWYDEISIYKQYLGREPNMANFMKWGHFTQVVWKGSTKLGMGIARKNGYIVVVANYDPPGNYKGQFAKNVK